MEIKKEEVMSMLGDYKGTENLVSKTSGNNVNNQIVTKFENGSTLTSYGTLVGVKVNGMLYLTPAHAFSKTTNKYVTQWCGLTKQERLSKIENCEIYMIV